MQRNKVLLFLFVLMLFLFAKPAAAFQTSYTYRNWFTVKIPGSNFDVVALYDFNGKESLIGGETEVITFPKAPNLALTIGAVGDFSNQDQSHLNQDHRQFLKGIPFAGVKYNIEQLEIKDILNVGAFYGRNFDEDEDIYGIKASKKFWGFDD